MPAVKYIRCWDTSLAKDSPKMDFRSGTSEYESRVMFSDMFLMLANVQVHILSLNIQCQSGIVFVLCFITVRLWRLQIVVSNDSKLPLVENGVVLWRCPCCEYIVHCIQSCRKWTFWRFNGLGACSSVGSEHAKWLCAGRKLVNEAWHCTVPCREVNIGRTHFTMLDNVLFGSDHNPAEKKMKLSFVFLEHTPLLLDGQKFAQSGIKNAVVFAQSGIKA